MARIAEKESAYNYGKRYVQTEPNIWEGREARGPRTIKRCGHTIKAKVGPSVWVLSPHGSDMGGLSTENQDSERNAGTQEVGQNR